VKWGGDHFDLLWAGKKRTPLRGLNWTPGVNFTNSSIQSLSSTGLVTLPVSVLSMVNRQCLHFQVVFRRQIGDYPSNGRRQFVYYQMDYAWFLSWSDKSSTSFTSNKMMEWNSIIYGMGKCLFNCVSKWFMLLEYILVAILFSKKKLFDLTDWIFRSNKSLKN